MENNKLEKQGYIAILQLLKVSVIALVISLGAFHFLNQTTAAQSGGIINVPGDAATIQTGIDLAQDGDVVLIAPGIYTESLVIANKTITLASFFHTTGNSSHIENTVIDGNQGFGLQIDSSVGPETTILGVTIQNSEDGVTGDGVFNFLYNRVISNVDGIDYEGGGGVVRHSLFTKNEDDAIDLDKSTAATVEFNTIIDNGDDGLEIRLQSHSSPTLNIVIRHNLIARNGEDGIQLIQHATQTNRIFLIERNLIQNNAQAGVGLMSNGNSNENYEGASLLERIFFFNNTVVGNDHGLTGGDNLVAINNIFATSTNIGVKNTDGNSILENNLFWNNGIDHQNSNVVLSTTTLADPLFIPGFLLSASSPAKDRGVISFTWQAEVVLNIDANQYFGISPDLGAFEFYPPLFLPVVLK